MSNRTCFLSFVTAGLVCATGHALADVEKVYSVTPTKFGLLEYMRPSHDIRLNGQTILRAGQIVDSYGYRLVWLEVKSVVAPSGAANMMDHGQEAAQRFSDRVIVAEAVDGTCLHRFVVLDFRGAKPFISQRFGPKTDGKGCLSFTRAKWGKKESYIYLAEGQLKYVYYTGGRILGPVE